MGDRCAECDALLNWRTAYRIDGRDLCMACRDRALLKREEDERVAQVAANGARKHRQRSKALGPSKHSRLPGGKIAGTLLILGITGLVIGGICVVTGSPSTRLASLP